MRSATSRMITAKRQAQQVGLEPGRRACAPYCAPITPPTQQQPGKHDIDRLGGQRVDHGRRRADREDHHQAGADHDPRRHAEQIDHRRDQDEAAADAEQHGQDAGDEAERQRRQRRNVQARGVEAPAQRQRRRPSGCGAAGASASAPGTQPSATSASLSIRAPIAPSSSDVERADHEVDLAARLEQAEQGRRRSSDPTMPPAIITPPILKSTPPRRQWANTPDTLAPVIWVVAEATATVGGMPIAIIEENPHSYERTVRRSSCSIESVRSFECRV